MSSPIFLIAIFLEQRADITRALSPRERLMTVSWIWSTKDEDQRFVKWKKKSHQSQQVDADLPKASAICYTSHIVAQRHGSAARFLFSKMAVDFPLLGFRAYYQAETKSADLATGEKKIHIEVGNWSSHAFLMRFFSFFFTSN